MDIIEGLLEVSSAQPVPSEGDVMLLARLLACVARSLDPGSRPSLPHQGWVPSTHLAPLPASEAVRSSVLSRLASLPVIPTTGCGPRVALSPSNALSQQVKAFIVPQAVTGLMGKAAARNLNQKLPQKDPPSGRAGVTSGQDFAEALSACQLDLVALTASLSAEQPEPRVVLVDPSFVYEMASHATESAVLSLLQGMGARQLTASSFLQDVALPTLRIHTKAFSDSSAAPCKDLRLSIMRLVAFPLAAGLLTSERAPHASSVGGPLMVPSSVVPSNAQQILLRQLAEAALLVTSKGRLIRPPVFASSELESDSCAKPGAEVAAYLPPALGGVDLDVIAPGFCAKAKGVTRVSEEYLSCCALVKRDAWTWLLR